MIKLFHGKDQFLSLRDAKKLYYSIIDSEPGIESIEIDAEASDVSEIIERYETQGMFSSSKVLFIKRLYLCNNYADLVEHMSGIEVHETNIQMIFWENRKIAANTKYLKLIKKIGEVSESPDLNKRTFSSWAKDEIKEEGLEIETDALVELAQRCNYEPERFTSELSKFKVLKKKIDLSAVKAITTDTFESDIWKLVDSINTGDKAVSARILENLISHNVEPHYILAMMYRNLRLIAQVKYLRDDGQDNRSIASSLKIPPFTVPSLVKSADRYSIQTILKLYEKLTNLDYQIKVGEIAPEMGLTLISTIL